MEESPTIEESSLCEFKDVYLIRSGTPVLQSVSFQLPRNGCLCVLGANGSGKTSLIRLLLGLVTPTKGSIIRNFVRAGYFGHRTLLYEQLTVKENLVFFNSLLDNPCTNLTDQIELWGLKKHQHKSLKNLSQGLLNKVALIRAFITAHELLVLDEPSAALDDASVILLKQALQAFVADGGTVVFTTHDLARMYNIASAAILVANTKIHSTAKDITGLKQLSGVYSELNR